VHVFESEFDMVYEDADDHPLLAFHVEAVPRLDGRGHPVHFAGTVFYLASTGLRLDTALLNKHIEIEVPYFS
jgi:hypothetical protein